MKGDLSLIATLGGGCAQHALAGSDHFYHQHYDTVTKYRINWQQDVPTLEIVQRTEGALPEWKK